MMTYGFGVSSFFKVKNNELFERWADTIGLDYTEEIQNSKEVMYQFRGDESGSLPTVRYDNDVDFWQELSEHLVDGWAVVYIASGHEGERAVFGFATSVDSEGNIINLSLDDIYEMIPQGKKITLFVHN